MKKSLVLAATLVAMAFPLLSEADQTARFSTAESTVGDLLGNAKARAILDKYVPGLSTSDQIDMARGMTLRGIQVFAPDTLKDETLDKIDGDFAKLTQDGK